MLLSCRVDDDREVVMSAVIAVPELMAEAATDVASIGSTINAAHLTAAAPTVAVIPAAADEVSAAIAHVFSVHAQGYQALAGQAAAFHQQFVQHLTASAGSFASAEAANVALLQPFTAIAGPVAGAAVAAQDYITITLSDFLTKLSALFQLILLSPFWLPIVALNLILALNHVSIFPPYNI